MYKSLSDFDDVFDWFETTTEVAVVTAVVVEAELTTSDLDGWAEFIIERLNVNSFLKFFLKLYTLLLNGDIVTLLLLDAVVSIFWFDIIVRQFGVIILLVKVGNSGEPYLSWNMQKSGFGQSLWIDTGSSHPFSNLSAKNQK